MDYTLLCSPLPGIKQAPKEVHAAVANECTPQPSSPKRRRSCSFLAKAEEYRAARRYIVALTSELDV